MVSTSALLISELEAIDGWPPERWAGTLHQIAKLFLCRAPGLTADQVALFDDVIVRLMDHVDTPALAKASQQLAEAKCAVPRTFWRLALHGDESVSLPIVKSARLMPELILEVARSGSPKQRLAIACRHLVDPSVSEVLMKSADPAIYHALAENLGATLSEADCARLVQISESDHGLAQKLIRRLDIPDPFKRKIRAKLDEARMRHLNAMPRVLRDQIEDTVAKTGASLADLDLSACAAAQAGMAELNRKGQLKDTTINRFAVRGEYTNVVAALAFLTGTPVEVILPLVASDNVEGLVLACKACRLDWATATSIVNHRPDHAPIAAAELQKARKTFDEISLSAAQRAVRF